MPRVGGMMLALVGCSEFRLGPTETEVARDKVALVQETFVQDPLPKVDLLFVIDDTPSMAGEQVALAEDFARLGSGLDNAGVAWHVGAVGSTLDGPEPGWLRGDPWLITTNTPDRESALRDLVQVGTEGIGPRAGLAAATEALALAEPGGPNAGFRRSDAVLHVVFVSDEDDASDEVFDDPVSHFGAVLVEQSSEDAAARSSALIDQADRYEEVVLASDGVLMSIRAVDFQPLLVDLGHASIAYRTRFALRETPTEDSLQVVIDRPYEGSWLVDYDEATLEFDVPPPPDAVISVEYTVSTTSPAESP